MPNNVANYHVGSLDSVLHGPAGVLKKQMMGFMAGMTQLSGATQPSRTTAQPHLPSAADRKVFSSQGWQVALRAAGAPQCLKLNAVAM